MSKAVDQRSAATGTGMPMNPLCVGEAEVEIGQPRDRARGVAGARPACRQSADERRGRVGQQERARDRRRTKDDGVREAVELGAKLSARRVAGEASRKAAVEGIRNHPPGRWPRLPTMRFRTMPRPARPSRSRQNVRQQIPSVERVKQDASSIIRKSFSQVRRTRQGDTLSFTLWTSA